MAFIHLEAFPVPSPRVLAHCPSEAGHERFSSMNPTNLTTPVCNFVNRFPCEAGHERLLPQKENKNTTSKHPHSMCSPSPIGVVPCSSPPTMNTCQPPSQDLDRLYSLLSVPESPTPGLTRRAEVLKPHASSTTDRQTVPTEMSLEAEETVRVIEWSKGLVLRAAEQARMEERRNMDHERFKLLLSKWKLQSRARAEGEEDGEQYVENEEREAYEVWWTGKSWPMSSALRRRDDENGQGLALLLTLSKQGDKDAAFTRFRWSNFSYSL